MNERIKRIALGVGIMYAAQSVILLAIHYTMPEQLPEAFNYLLAAIGCTMTAFLIGGFVIGLMTERVLIVEPAVAAIGALLIDALFTNAGLMKDVFLFSSALQTAQYGTALILAALAIVSALAGGLAGERMVTPQDEWVSQAVSVIGLIGLFLGPFVVLSAYVPVMFSIIIGLAFFVGILVAAYRFKSTSRGMEEISINPESYDSTRTRHAN